MPVYKVMFSETFIYEVEVEAPNRDAVEEVFLNTISDPTEEALFLDNETNIEEVELVK
jgi:hypothetical protein